jgi:hypothetical protein
MLFLGCLAFVGVTTSAFADDPMNQPLDSVGVSGYDSTLCNDKWNTCTDYDRQHFDARYPGVSLNTLSLYPISPREEGVAGSEDTSLAHPYLEDYSSRYGEGARSDRGAEVLSEDDAAY